MKIKLLYKVLPLKHFVTQNLEASVLMRRTKAIMLTAIMAALANILSIPPIAVLLAVGGFESAIHFSQLAIFISGILAGPTYGLITGAIGGLYMSYTKIPFIIGGLAILGYAAGFFSKKLTPSLSGILAWCVQAPYVVVTDYVWFNIFLEKTQAATWAILTTIMIKLTIEAVICSVLAGIFVRYIKRAGIIPSEG